MRLMLAMAARATVQVASPWLTYGRAATTIDGTQVDITDVGGEQVGYSGLPGERVAVTAEGIIWPVVPLAFVYEPQAHGPGLLRAYAQQLAEDVRQSIIDQADILEQRAKTKRPNLRF